MLQLQVVAHATAVAVERHGTDAIQRRRGGPFLVGPVLVAVVVQQPLLAGRGRMPPLQVQGGVEAVRTAFGVVIEGRIGITQLAAAAAGCKAEHEFVVVTDTPVAAQGGKREVLSVMQAGKALILLDRRIQIAGCLFLKYRPAPGPHP